MEEQVSWLASMFAQQYGRGGGRGGYNGGGRPRGRGGNENANGARSRSPSWDKLNLSKDIYFKRKNDRLCYGCGSADHRIGECPHTKQREKKEEEK